MSIIIDRNKVLMDLEDSWWMMMHYHNDKTVDNKYNLDIHYTINHIESAMKEVFISNKSEDEIINVEECYLNDGQSYRTEMEYIIYNFKDWGKV